MNGFKSVIILMCEGAMLWLMACTVSQPPSVQSEKVVYQSGQYALHKFVSRAAYPKLAKIYLGDESQVWKIEDANDLSTKGRDPFIRIPLKETHRGGIYESGYQSIPILCYHKFGSGDRSNMTIPTHVFEQQMKYLKENGYRVITPHQLHDFLAYRRQIPKKSVLITIDDGYRSVYDVAWPILKKYGFTATFFVYTDYVGISKKAITWDQLATLKNAGFTIGSHTVTHSDLTKKREDETDAEFAQRLKKEIFLSKQIIDEKLGQDTICFSFPYGRYNKTLMEMVQAAGYKIAVTVERGSNPFFANPLALKRDMILRHDISCFISRLKIFNPISLK